MSFGRVVGCPEGGVRRKRKIPSAKFLVKVAKKKKGPYAQRGGGAGNTRGPKTAKRGALVR